MAWRGREVLAECVGYSTERRMSGAEYVVYITSVVSTLTCYGQLFREVEMWKYFLAFLSPNFSIHNMFFCDNCQFLY
jgi:hypothetical protein